MSPLKQPSTRNSQAIDSPPFAVAERRIRKERVNAESIQEFIKRKMEEFDFDSGGVCTFNVAEMLL